MISPCEPALHFSACYVYSPRGVSPAAKGSRRLRERLKGCDARWLRRYAMRVREQSIGQRRYGDLFGSDVILVPVPRSVPSSCDASWAAAQLALALQQQGLAAAVWIGLRRHCAVRKSATAPCRARPTVAEHYNSFVVDVSLRSPRRILLVDDFVTRGRTLLAASMRMRERFPRAQLGAFALVRTLGLVPDIAQLVDSCKGAITWTGKDARREP
ncbi:MAG TPA: phosphoribosyltransferase [Steroidobacteraceae bacterium]